MRAFALAVVLAVVAIGHPLCGRGATALADEDPPKPILMLDAGGHSGNVRKLCFTPDGKELISVSGDKTIRFWDVQTGELLRVLHPPIGPGRRGAECGRTFSRRPHAGCRRRRRGGGNERGLPHRAPFRADKTDA